MRLTAASIQTIFKKFQAQNPEPDTELNYKNNFELLVAVILSAQATDVSVNKETPALFAVADTPQKMLDLGEERVRSYITSIGLYRNKAKHIMGTSNMLVRDYAGEVPDQRKALESLPGVGQKTASVVLNVLFGEHTVAVDTHVFRVSHRIGLASGKTPKAVEKTLTSVIPEEFLHHAHHWLILHGRYTCTAKRPKCSICLIEQECQWNEKYSFMHYGKEI